MSDPILSRVEDILDNLVNGNPIDFPRPQSRVEKLLWQLSGSIVTLDESGLIPLNLIPPVAFAECVTVQDDTARFALTTDDVQNGDTVYVNSTQIMYFVVDETKLDLEAGYKSLAAGIAAQAVADKNGNDITTTYQTKVLGSWTAGTETSHSTPAGTDTVLQALEKIDNNQRLDETNIKANFSGHVKNIFTYSIAELMSINTGGVWDDNEYTYNGITYTINDDMTISLSGSVTTGAVVSMMYLKYYGDVTLTEYEGFHGSGCPSGGGMDKYVLYFDENCIDLGDGVVIHNPSAVGILILEGAELPSESFKPMICTVEDWEESSEYVPHILTNKDLTEFSNHVYDNLSVKYAINSTRCQRNKTCFFGFVEKSWSIPSINYGQNIWTTGEDIFYCNGLEKYIYNRSTSKWEAVDWSEEIYGAFIWTDGENIYHSNGNTQYVLDVSTSTWSEKTWDGLTNFRGAYIWTDGENIYYSYSGTQYVLDKSTSTWSTKTWDGLSSFDGSNVWTDGENIYYSNGSNQYILDVSTSTWSTKTWDGLTNFRGAYIWTDGENIYYSNGSNQYVLDKSTSTWSTKTWDGLTNFLGDSIWTDGENIYYSYYDEEYVLKKVSVR